MKPWGTSLAAQTKPGNCKNMCLAALCQNKSGVALKAEGDHQAKGSSGSLNYKGGQNKANRKYSTYTCLTTQTVQAALDAAGIQAENEECTSMESGPQRLWYNVDLAVWIDVVWYLLAYIRLLIGLASICLFLEPLLGSQVITDIIRRSTWALCRACRWGHNWAYWKKSVFWLLGYLAIDQCILFLPLDLLQLTA